MKIIQQALEASLEDFAISRSERKQLKQLLNTIQGNKTEQAKVRQLAYGSKANTIQIVRSRWYKFSFLTFYGCCNPKSLLLKPQSIENIRIEAS